MQSRESLVVAQALTGNHGEARATPGGCFALRPRGPRRRLARAVFFGIIAARGHGAASARGLDSGLRLARRYAFAFCGRSRGWDAEPGRRTSCRCRLGTGAVVRVELGKWSHVRSAGAMMFGGTGLAY